MALALSAFDATTRDVESERERLRADARRVISGLAKAVGNEAGNTVVFALAAFCVSVCREVGLPLDQFVGLMRRSDR